MKKLFKFAISCITAISALLVSNVANADEGMWLPNMINAVIGDMQAKGFHLNAEDVYSVN
ncbi:MAG: hypothetical protein HUJ90_01470, partial [Bacteroidales bacterium]|nr:hypothetical protein [Bacteroidales bacterium]